MEGDAARTRGAGRGESGGAEDMAHDHAGLAAARATAAASRSAPVLLAWCAAGAAAVEATERDTDVRTTPSRPISHHGARRRHANDLEAALQGYATIALGSAWAALPPTTPTPSTAAALPRRAHPNWLCGYAQRLTAWALPPFPYGRRVCGEAELLASSEATEIVSALSEADDSGASAVTQPPEGLRREGLCASLSTSGRCA